MEDIISWAITIILITLGLQVFDSIPITSGLLFLLGLSFIPGLRSLVKKTIKRNLPTKKRRRIYVIVTILIIIIAYKEIQYNNEQEKETIRLEKVAERKAQIDKKNRISREVQRLKELRELRKKEI